MRFAAYEYTESDSDRSTVVPMPESNAELPESTETSSPQSPETTQHFRRSGFWIQAGGLAVMLVGGAAAVLVYSFRIICVTLFQVVVLVPSISSHVGACNFNESDTTFQ